MFLSDSSKLFPEFSVDAVATSALRDAANSSEICGKVFDATSIKIRILSGKEEAELSYRGAMSDPAVNGNLSNLFFDLGGGSMEVVCGENGRVVSSESFKIGAVRMTRKFLASGISNANLAEIKNSHWANLKKAENCTNRFFSGRGRGCGCCPHYEALHEFYISGEYFKFGGV